MQAPGSEEAGETLYAFRRNLVVAASAGTGKTHSLVGVIIHVLLGASELGGEGLHAAVDPGRVVATTFSRKAAAEIRARIVEELERLVTGDPGSKYRADLDVACVRAGVKPWGDKPVAERARRALDGLGRAQIGTLHSFAGTIARAHALELGLSPGFEMADEEASRLRASECIVRVLERGLTEGDAGARDVRTLVDIAGGVDRLVTQIARLLNRLEEDGRGAKELAIADDDAKVADAALGTLLEHARALAGDERFEVPVRDLLHAWDSVDQAGLEVAAGALFSLRPGKNRSALAEEFFAWRNDLPGTTNADRARRLVLAWRARDSFAPFATKARALLAACQDEIARETRRTSLLGFGDVLLAARDVLRDHPSLAAELGASIDVFMVDEFQDTSRLQRELVQLVWGKEARRPAGVVPDVSMLRPCGLFVVGDRKQSIYGFRGADVSVFAEFCVGLGGKTAREALGIAPHAAWEPEEPTADFISLRHNRRGEPSLLTFANAFSKRRFAIAEPPAALYEIDYVPETEDLLPPPGRETIADMPRTTWLRVKGEGDTSTRPDEAFAIAHRIAKMMAEGTPTVRGAPPRWRDIAVLAHTNEMLDAAAFALAHGGIPHVVAGRGFYSAPEVRDLVAMLALICDPGQRLAMMEVLRGPWAGVNDATLIALTEPRWGLTEVGSAWDTGERRAAIDPKDQEALDRVRRTVRGLRHNLDRLGPAGVLREAIRELALEETLVLLPRGAQRIANVRKLLVMAEREKSARRFIERLDEAAERDTAESEAATFSDEDDAVRLLTVHASKGLDFPIVFVPQVGIDPPRREHTAMALEFRSGGAPNVLSARIISADGTLCDPPSYVRSLATAERRHRAERQRLAYVAMTRASEAMLLVGSRRVPKSGESPAYRATTAATLADLAYDEGALQKAALIVEDVSASAPPLAYATTPLPTVESPRELVPNPALGCPSWRSLPIAPTSLQDFHNCPRRFQLVHLLDFPEHPVGAVSHAASAANRDADEADAASAPRLDARAEGTLAHRILERIAPHHFGDPDAAREASAILAREGIAVEHAKHGAVVGRVTRFLTGAYAKRVGEAGAEVLREQPFVLSIPDAEGRTIALRGSIDLLVVWPDGRADIIDYKRARGPSAEPYAFQLDVYQLAAESMLPTETRIRAGIIFLGGDAAEPMWCTQVRSEDVRARLGALGAQLVRARWTETFPRVEPPRCRAIHCGFMSLCHPS